MPTNCILIAPTLISLHVYAEYIYVFLLKSCTRHWIPCWSLIAHVIDFSTLNRFKKSLHKVDFSSFITIE